MEGISHHRQAARNVEDELEGIAAVDSGRRDKLSAVSGVFVCGCVGFNELGFNCGRRSLYHLYAIALRIVLNFVHDVVYQQNAAAR
jgi:hypothetical protein